MAYKIMYLTMYFVFKKSLSICHIIQRHLYPFPKLETFFEIFRVWALRIGFSQYEKVILGIFVYLFIYKLQRQK